MPRKKKAPSWTLDPQRLDECNDTELVQIARRLGFEHASLQVPREVLEAHILGAEVEWEDPLADIRRWTFDYLNGNTQIMHSQLTCSVHCPTCPHDRVVDCYSTNHDKVTPEIDDHGRRIPLPLPTE